MTPELLIADPEWPFTKAKTSVLRAAAGVIHDLGPRAATLKNIATRAGITEPAIFRHFEGIDGLFGGLFAAYERLFTRFSAVHVETDLVGIERFRLGIMSSVELIAASREFAYVIIHAEQVFRGYPELRARIAELKARDQGYVLDALNQALERGEVRSDVELMSIASAVMGMIYFTIVFWIDSNFSFDLVKTAEARVEDALRLTAGPVPRRSPRR